MAALSLWWQWRHARRLLRGVYGDDLRLALVRELDAYCDLLGTHTHTHHRTRTWYNTAQHDTTRAHM
jgi:hypothetical protein